MGMPSTREGKECHWCVCGVCASGEPLYIGRAYHEGTLTIGKVQPSRRCLSIPYGGEEHCYSDYEVLVVQTVNF
ncbi:hypothetical protein MRX96_005380 [Rhipicephalus microplus]